MWHGTCKDLLTVHQDDVVPSEDIYTYPIIHTFPTSRSKLICREVLYVADRRLESHYKRTDKKNRGKYR